MENKMDKCKQFYEDVDRENTYTITQYVEEHPAFRQVQIFIEKNKLYNKKCLEIGSAKGLYQNMVEDYMGIDIAKSLSKYYTKPFFTINEDGNYPFENDSIDAIWTYAVHEHIPDLNKSLQELKRILKPGGSVLFFPAWQCRSWAANGYEVRPYRDFDLFGKVIKASIPFRNSILFRALYIFPKRAIRSISYILGKRYIKIKYKILKPNYDFYWVSDSDAVNSIDPHDAILWFLSNGFICKSHPTHFKAFFVRTGALEFVKK